MSYVELHASSAFSFLDGASTPENLSCRAAELEIPAMALLDRDGVYGAPQFFMCTRKGRPSTHPHVGAEVTSVSGVRYALLAETRAGYRNLCRLITRMKLRAPKGQAAATDSDFAEFAGGLIALTGGEEGPVRTALRHGGPTEGRRALESMIRCYGHDCVYVELQRHFDREEEALNQLAIALAREFRLPLVATNGVRYALKRERKVLDVFTCIRNHRTLETAGRLLSGNSERHLKSHREMSGLFRDLPEAIANTSEVSSRLQFTLDNLGYEFPAYPVPDGETMASFLRKRTDEGAHERFRPYSEKARKQIERELALIEQLHLEGYFLIVRDIVEFCRKNNILVQGRGSAANSSVCYALRITAIDPVAGDLLFERFLSEERNEWPDIDLDLPSGNQRERAIQYVLERYGKYGAAMTANIITYRGRSAAREVGKALGFETAQVESLARVVSTWGFQDDTDGDDALPAQFKNAGFDVCHPQVRTFLELCLAIRDLPRHLGQHSGGLVICQGSLDAVVPIEPASMPNRTVVQWDKDDCANMGIIKVDLLGLGMMAVLEDSFQLIREHDDKEVSLAGIPLDDPDVFAALQKADTIGMFQVESRAQMSCLPRLHPETFYDIVVEVAIIRPGPIVGQMVHPYLNRRRGRERVTYPHPSLEPILARTLGVPLFQEQLIRIAMIAAGFTGGEAEELRRAFGFKRSEKRMKEIEVKLREGMNRKGITGAPQDEIIQSITSFALYGFPESHAASFALLSNASAYLKCHYLAAFTAAMLNNQPMGFYSPATLVKDAQRHGLHFRPVDVTLSGWPCTLEKDSPQENWRVRLGLRYVSGLRESAAQALLGERAVRPFASIDELARRVPELRRDELGLLAEIGALNVLDPEHAIHRRDALWHIERAAQHTGPLLETLDQPDRASPLEAMTAEERLVADFDGTGLTIGLHPMQLCRSELMRQGVLRAIDLFNTANGTRVRIAGCVIARQRPGTAKGFVFMSLEDETGISNVIFMPDVFLEHRWTITESGFLLIEGILQNLDGVRSVKASAVETLHVTAAVTSSHDFH